LCPKPVDISKIMKTIIAFLFFFLLNTSNCYSQCDCYTIKKIWIPEDVKGKVYITFYNECDINVYLKFWLIYEKDTIARFDQCACGGIEINKNNETNYLDTKITKLPPLNLLRVAMSNGTLKCSSIKFSPELFVLGTEQEAINETTIYPNPTNDSISLENIPFNTIVQLYNLQGVFLQELIFREKQKISLKSYPSGTYLLKYQINNQTITHKIVKQ
jgi:hypothetical protein